MLEHNGKQNARTREIVKKIVNHMTHSFLLFLCLDDSIHIISEIYDDIFVELKIDRECDISRIHNILAKYTRHRRGFRYLCQTLELLDMLINMASNKLLNRLLILLNALSEQYNTESEKIRQSVNSTVEHMLHIYHEICHALNDNFDEVLEKSRDFSILLTSNKAKKSLKKIFQCLMLCKVPKFVKIESSPEAKYDDNLQETLELLKSNLFSVQLTSNSVRDCLLIRSAFQLIFKMLFICEAYLESFDVLNSGNGMRVSQ
ncbi:hypothetical protein THOM_2252 [Trachipleistophora hominis]|uniref:Uncharacterized protein n=1 Tax=Trachipleistophora hominis TaxID=72359 RepID=L7JTS0_TRAHO|nr:hypothetical protein THOM_2252 [Trachipleistophora hominis]